MRGGNKREGERERENGGEMEKMRERETDRQRVKKNLYLDALT